VADFIKLYIVLVFIPVAAVTVPALLTWARDLNATARRMRRLDELDKVVRFWDSWMKTTATLVPFDGRYNANTESRIHGLVRLARVELADAGIEALFVRKSSEFEELGKYKLDFVEFQKFRAGLPWYRRVLLLYSAPNRFVRIPKVLFYLELSLTLLMLFVTFGGHIVPLSLREWEPWPIRSSDAFALAHPVLSRVVLWAYFVGLVLFMRWEVTRIENNRRCYVQDRIRERLGPTEEEVASAGG
jgi:hypothetical protein